MCNEYCGSDDFPEFDFTGGNDETNFAAPFIVTVTVTTYHWRPDAFMGNQTSVAAHYDTMAEAVSYIMAQDAEPNDEIRYNLVSSATSRRISNWFPFAPDTTPSHMTHALRVTRDT